eukprot:4770072-Prymnesium_polylepis.2
MRPDAHIRAAEGGAHPARAARGRRRRCRVLLCVRRSGIARPLVARVPARVRPRRTPRRLPVCAFRLRPSLPRPSGHCPTSATPLQRAPLRWPALISGRARAAGRRCDGRPACRCARRLGSRIAAVAACTARSLLVRPSLEDAAA